MKKFVLQSLFVSNAPFFYATIFALCCIWTNTTHAQSTQWIWAPEHSKDNVPQTACHFRKSINLDFPEEGQIVIAADDRYELYLNGRRIGTGGGWKQFDSYDISRNLMRGKNVIAVKVTNSTGKSAGLVARVIVKEKGGTHVAYSTNNTWKSSLRPLAFWQANRYSDRRWSNAKTYGPVGRTEPWIDPATQTSEGVEPGRFNLSNEFEIQEIVNHDDVGSLISMTLNEFGEIIASREEGPLLLITDGNNDKIPDKVQVYCDEVSSCQGILALNGDVYVVGDGPDGSALYHLSDSNRDRKLEIVGTILKFKGELGEHGPHDLVLGLDGYLYVVVGNHTSVDKEYSENSPHKNYYEGDLITPRYEDPGGHANGLKVPGGVVIRTDTKGHDVELVAGGLRNPYDIVVTRNGELFVHDADMEWDEGTSWYRPTRLTHIVPGGEYGWRSGWAKWPEYFLDSLPSSAKTGLGSPTGVVQYDHFMFPKRYHQALFSCDWSQGRILTMKLERSGAGYKATSEVFLEGQPLNATDLEVGPNGSLYFSTGGRGTNGGIYRITWKGKVPDSVTDIGTGIRGAIRQPQLAGAWARQRVAQFQADSGEKWNSQVVGVVRTQKNPVHYRVRALDLMQLFGPDPSDALLQELSQDTNPEIREKVAKMLGMRTDAASQQLLVTLLTDSDPSVRRIACQSLMRNGGTVPAGSLFKSLSSADRFESWAARRLLERIPLTQWKENILTTKNNRLFVQGSVAMLIAHPEKENALEIIQRSQKLLLGFVNDRDFIDILRVVELALHRGQIEAAEIPQLAAQLAEEFPAGSSVMNRELSRLLAYLQETSITQRYIDFLKSDASDIDKLHVALHVGLLNDGWTTEQKLDLLKYYEEALTLKGGTSLSGYIQNVSRAFAQNLTANQMQRVLANGSQMPNAALATLYKLPDHPSENVIEYLKSLDRQITVIDSKAANRLGIGIIAVLARDGRSESMAYLRDIWERFPQRRISVAMGLSQDPTGENWTYLLRSLPILEGSAAQAVLIKLSSSEQIPEEPEHFRQVILRGLKLKENGGQHAFTLLENWTGENPAEEDGSTEESLAAWQQWFAAKYPDKPEAKLPEETGQNKWALDELLEYLGGDEAAKASPTRGAVVFQKAQCVKCHRVGSEGETIGPDLTSVASRFQKKEILESILHPSLVISDQYISRNILTTDGRTLSGIVAPAGPDEVTLLQSDGQKIKLTKDNVEEVSISKTSSMPEGLLNSLSLEEVADLFAFLTNSRRTSLTKRRTLSER